MFKKGHKLLNRLISSRTFFLLIIGWFIAQAVFIALATKYGIPPDETYHFNLIKLYSENFPSPFIHDQSGYYFLGEVTRAPGYLYHYLLGVPYKIFPESFLIPGLRLINVGLGTLTLLALAGFMKQLKLPPAVKNLSLFILSNTLMFVFLSSAINYDNLVNLLSIISFWLTAKLYQQPTLRSLILFLSVLAFGSLTKLAFLPLALILLTILLVTRWRQFAKLLQSPRQYLMANKTLLATILLAVGIILIIERYGYNLLKYQTPMPACDTVHSVAQCRASAIYNRNNSFLANPKPVKLEAVEFSARWGWSMKAKIYGIMGHKAFHDIGLVKLGTFAYLGLAVVAIIRKYQKRDKLLNILLAISLGYLFILMFQNLLTYRRTGLYGLALQGRYAFPVLPVIYAVANKHILRMLGTRLRVIFILGVLMIFGLAGLPMYLSSTDPSWHNPSHIELNQQLKALLINFYR